MRQRRCRLISLIVGCTLSCGVRHADAANVARAAYGITNAGEQVEIFTLTNRHGMSARVLSYGGIIERISVPDRHGIPGNVTLTLADLKAYEARANFSSLLGRYANRISGGGFMLDGVRYELPSNADGISSHGGPRGFGARHWKARPFHRGVAAGVVLTYLSVDGENGYPGSLSVQVTYTLTEQNAFRIEYFATTDKPTVLNLSHHVYFNLAGGGCICDHKLQIFADSYARIDARKLATGPIDPVQGTPLDLREPVRLSERMDSDHPQIVFANGFDHTFVLNKTGVGRRSHAVHVEDPASGRMLDVYTTEPGVHLFTANGFDGSLKDPAGNSIVRRSGLALETQHFPDSPNQPTFPSTVLRPGQRFESTTEYRFRTTSRAAE